MRVFRKGEIIVIVFVKSDEVLLVDSETGEIMIRETEGSKDMRISRAVMTCRYADVGGELIYSKG
ncbi:hypothetical protein BSA145_07720 [Bacillus safensis]|uniref:Uncharacterized protein n=1 Tax=Bacillus safensis TaxID=561879 RepID=A0A1L6ZGZ8_BACIA|nr:hypothetical protein BSA145_07720 [Bacillus safensis]